nr:AP-3 complex subunit sigma [Cryptococcus depauperatus CBS 7841]
MIHAVLIFNTNGKPRLSKFFTPLPPLVQQSLISQIFSLISDRPQGVCNFLDAPELVFPMPKSMEKRKEERLGVEESKKGEDDTRVIYRHYATLYFVFVVDGAEIVDSRTIEYGCAELLDQVFVESLDRSFENVCELDLIFHFDEVHHVLSEIIQGGLVLETNINEVSACVRTASKHRKESQNSSNPLIPSVLAASGGRGGSADGARRWLAAMGV